MCQLLIIPTQFGVQITHNNSYNEAHVCVLTIKNNYSFYHSI